MLYRLKLFIQSHLQLVIVGGGLVVLLVGMIITIALLHQAATSPVAKNDTSSSKSSDTSKTSNSNQQTESKKSQSKTDASKQASNGSKPSTPGRSGTSNGGNSTGGGSGGTGGGTVQPPPSSGGTQKNCVAHPSACGYPDATNTGYAPTGVTLTTNGIDINVDGDFIIDQDNTVIDSKRIDGCVIIRAKNVTIRRSLITNCQAYYNIWLQELPGGGIRDTSNFLMEDVEVDGNNVFTNAAIVDDNGKGLVIRRMNMHNVADGPHPGENWLIEESYIHDMYVCPNDCHTDSIQSAGAINVTLRHNTIMNNPDNNGTGGKNAVVRIATEQGPVSGFVVDNNLLDGGNYAVQVRSQGNGAPAGVVVTNNRIVPTWRFAPYDFTDIPVTLSGNFRDDTLEALNTPM